MTRTTPRPSILKRSNPVMIADIPRANALNSKNPIQIETPSGIIRFYPEKYIRGTGNKKYYLTLRGIASAEVKQREQCYVYYKGNQLGGEFTLVAKTATDQPLWHATFETIIPTAEFWDGVP